jgi:predicted dehydrogenase
MLDDEKPDAIVAITPLDLTLPMGREFLAYGLPVLLEKPPGRTVPEARELAAAAETTGTPHMISFNRRFGPAVLAARRWLADEAGSLPDQVIARMLRVSRLEPTFIMGTGIHLVDTVLSFLGDARRVSSLRHHTHAGGQCASAQVEGAHGNATLVIAPDCGTMAETYELIGDEYTIYIDVVSSQCIVVRAGDVVLHERFDHEPAFVANGTYAETAAFLEAVETGRGYSPTLQQGLASMLLADAVDRGVSGAVGNG